MTALRLLAAVATTLRQARLICLILPVTFRRAERGLDERVGVLPELLSRLRLQGSQVCLPV